MKKLVQEANGQKRKFIVSENMIKEGYFFGEQSDLVTFATSKELLEFENQTEIQNFEEFIKIKGLKYCTIPHLVDKDKVKILRMEFPFYYQEYCHEISNSSELYNNERCEYIEINQQQIPVRSQEDLFLINEDADVKMYQSVENNRVYLCSGNILDPVVEIRKRGEKEICKDSLI